MAVVVDVFNTLSSKITQLSLARIKNDRDVLNSTLNELNALNYKYTVVTNPTKAVLLINQCCSLIPPEDSELVAKCCLLITNVTTRQKVVVEGRTLILAVLWCLQALMGKSTDIGVLTALDGLIRGSVGHNLIVEVVKSAPLMEYVKSSKNPETAFLALQCLEACTLSLDETKTKCPCLRELQVAFDIFLSHLTMDNLIIDKLINIKIFIICLRGLQNIIRQKPDLLPPNIGIILGVIKSYMLLGIPKIEFLRPQKLLPSPLSIPEAATTSREKGGKMAKHRKPKTQPAAMKIRKKEKWDDDGGGYIPATSVNTEDGYSSFSNSARSDSDFSDTEGGNVAKLAVMSGRLRQAALGLFLHAVRLTEKTVIFSFWSSFIPENRSANAHNLVTCILKETSNKGRMAALNALLILLSACKLYLAQAEKGENLAFTPFSVVLGLMIKELHRCLSLALTAISAPVLTLILKCFAALVQATPYHRLSPGLITKVIRNVKPFIYHKDSTLQVTSLIVLGCILAAEPPIPETRDCLLKNIQQNTNEEKKEQHNSEDNFEFAEFSSEDEEVVVENNIPWLLERCLYNLDCDTVPMAVKLESLQIISVMSRNYFEVMLAPNLNLVTKAVLVSLGSKYQDVQFHAGRAVDFLGQAMSRTGERQSLTFWQCLLSGALTGLLQSGQPMLRGVGCDCLGSIGGEIFSQLARDRQILCVTLLFACSRDDESNVKGAAVRALGICVLYPSLIEDSGFVVDTAETIHRVLQDENFTVKVKASWALGNLSDALVLNKSDEEFPESVILKLLKSTVKASNDSDKIAMNTVRALGNFLQLIDTNLIQDGHFKQATDDAIAILLKKSTSSSNAKVRWNSCYAIGNAMKNPIFFTCKFPLEQIFNTLTDLVVNFRNFKVRINAAVALAVPKSRDFYKQWYQPIWVALIKALEASENMEDFNEYKHRDNLVEQICLTLGHLMTLLTVDDLASLKGSIQGDQLQVHMKRVWERLLPEKSTVLFEARAHVDTISRDGLSSDQKSILEYLSNTLKQEF